MNRSGEASTSLVHSLVLSGRGSLKTLAQFDFLAAPGVIRTLIQELATCTFIPRHEKFLLCGPTGLGKSYLADTVAIEALKSNYRVLSRPPHRLLNDLHAVRASGSHSHVLARILHCDLLELNDFGLQALSTLAAQVCYEIITERYERSSLIMTSNWVFAMWTEFFMMTVLPVPRWIVSHTRPVVGQSTIQWQGLAYSITKPEVIATATVQPFMAACERIVLRPIQVHQFLKVHWIAAL